MHGAAEFIKSLAMVLCVAGIITVIFQRLRQPVVFGYLVAGMIVGPHIPIPLVADTETVRTLSELGVILLLFSMGLEFRLSKLIAVGPTAGAIAVINSSLMIWLGYEAGRLFGWTPLESFYAGAIVAISSTTIISKAFLEQGVKGKHTEIVFGVLISDDLIAIFLLTVLTAVSLAGGISAGSLAAAGGRLAAFLAGLLVVGMLTVPRLTRALVRMDRPETTLVATIGICFAFALLAQVFGYSVALGAFIAGSLVAESGVETAIKPLVEPVRNMFAPIFFVSVGMLIDPVLVARHWEAVLIFTLLVVFGKIGGVTLGAFLTGHGIRTSVQVGMSLAQIGEYSYIIAGIGLTTGATREFLYPVAVAVSAATTLLTPWMIRWSDPVASCVDRRLPRPLRTFTALYDSWLAQLRAGLSVEPAAGSISLRARRAVRAIGIDAVFLAFIVVGWRVFESRAFAMIYAWTAASPTIARWMLLSAVIVLCAPFLYGIIRGAGFLGLALAARVMPEAEAGTLDLAAAPRRALVVTLQIGIILLVGMPLLAIFQPLLPRLSGVAVFAGALLVLGIWFWRSAANLEGHVLAVSQIIADALMKQTGLKDTTDEADAFRRIREVLPGLGNIVPLRLDPGSFSAGRTLAEMQVGNLTGAAVLVIMRDKGKAIIPTGKDTLREGDLVALAGAPEAVEAARKLLVSGPDNSR
jgi:monovalent cation:H+ antiporter-2, CPA2 family